MEVGVYLEGHVLLTPHAGRPDACEMLERFLDGHAVQHN